MQVGNLWKRERIGLLLLCCLLFAGAGAQPLCARVVVVQEDQVNVRRSAGLDATVAGKAAKGAVYAWLGAEEGWTMIAFSDGKPGYIRNDLLRGYDEAVVTGASVRIRQAPSLQGAILGGVKKGDRLSVQDYQGNWYKVRYGQAEGWISADFATLGEAIELAAVSGGQPATPDAQAAQPDVPPGFDSSTVGVGAPGGPLSGMIITLDPGHGTAAEGKPADPGAESASLGIWERDVNLDIALKLKRLLEASGATIWMTHTGYTSLDLNGRAALANRNGSHAFISIHTNSSENPALSGHSVYFYAPAASERLSSQRGVRQALAKAVQNSLTAYCGRADLGIKEGNFAVLRETNCPSILIETAFLSNAQEELLLAQGAFRQKLAEAIADGILRYYH